MDALLWMDTVHSGDQLLIVGEHGAQCTFSSLATLLDESPHCRWPGSEPVRGMGFSPCSGQREAGLPMFVLGTPVRQERPEPLSVSAIPERVFVYNGFVSLEL